MAAVSQRLAEYIAWAARAFVRGAVERHMGPLDCKIQWQIGDVFQALTVRHDCQQIAGFGLVYGFHRVLKLWKCNMVNTVDIACAQCKRTQAAWCGFGRNTDDMWSATFAVSD